MAKPIDEKRLAGARTDLRDFLQTPAGQLAHGRQGPLQEALTRPRLEAETGGNRLKAAVNRIPKVALRRSVKRAGLLDEQRPVAIPPSVPRVAILPGGDTQAVGSSADLGGLIRRSRKAMKLSQESFADLAGVGRRFLIELEAGKPTVELDKVLGVCKAAGIDLLARRR